MGQSHQGVTPAQERSLRLWLRDQPPALERLPWDGPRDAYGWLSAAQRRRVDDLGHQLDAAGCGEGAHVEAGRAFARLNPQSRIAFYPGSPPGGPTWFVQTITSGEPTTDPLRHHEVLPQVRLYELDGEDPFADRPAALAALARRATRRDNVIPLVERILHTNDVDQQLRMVLYTRGRASLFVGWYRRRGGPAFSLDDHALLLAARPALRRWSRTASAIGVAPVGDGALVATLGALDGPALLLRRGRVIHANTRGSAQIDRTLAWHRAGRPAGFATVTPLAPRGLSLDLVLPYVRAAPAPASAAPDVTAPAPALTLAHAALPPSLARVADLVAAGLSDKEVAQRLDMPLATARTYVARVLRRLGLHDRRALMLRSRAS